MQAWQHAASESCTRAGLTALLAASLSFSLLPAVKVTPSLEAFGEYVNARAELETALEELGYEPCWADISTGAHGAEVASLPVSRLLLLQCRAPSSQPIVSGLQFSPAPTREGHFIITQPPGNAPNGAPLAPQLAYVQPIAGMWAVRDALVRLNDPRITNEARTLSPEVDRMIYRWQSRVYSTSVMRTLPTITIAREQSDAPVTDHSVEEDTKALLDVMRIEDVRAISKHAPATDETVQRARSSLWAGSLPGLADTRFALAMAPSLLLSLSAVATAWMWLSVREYRVMTADATAVGGVVAMFGRTRASRALLVVMLSCPAIAAASLGRAASAMSWWNPALAFVVVVMTLATCVESRSVWADPERTGRVDSLDTGEHRDVAATRGSNTPAEKASSG